jgi:hypothetical protein
MIARTTVMRPLEKIVLVGEPDPHDPVGGRARELVEGEAVRDTEMRLVAERPSDPGLRGERETEQLG